MAIDFNARLVVVNPTNFFIGRLILAGGIIAVVVGIITLSTDEFLLPDQAWIALGIPAIFVGGALTWTSLRRN